MTSPIEIYICYNREDAKTLARLEPHLGALKRQNIFDAWHKKEIGAGIERNQETDRHFCAAQIILLLVSPHFVSSEDCIREMERAMQRHEAGDARVIPVLVEPVYWEGLPIAKLQCLPENCRFVRSWTKREEAIFRVAEGIRKAATQIRLDNDDKERGSI